jgi:hypothetical protein
MQCPWCWHAHMLVALGKQVAIAGLGLEEEKKEAKVKVKSRQKIMEEEMLQLTTEYDARRKKRAAAATQQQRSERKAWCLRLHIIEAEYLPVSDYYLRDTNLVGMADPYVAARVDPYVDKRIRDAWYIDEKKEEAKVLYRTDTQYRYRSASMARTHIEGVYAHALCTAFCTHSHTPACI